MAEQYFMGLDGFIWFVGVVENRNDPPNLAEFKFDVQDITPKI